MPATNKNPALRNHEQNRNYRLPAWLFFASQQINFQKGTVGDYQGIKGR